MPTVPVMPNDQRKRDTTTRGLLIATGFVIATSAGAVLSATGIDALQKGILAFAFDRDMPAAAAPMQPQQAAAIAKLQDGLGLVLREIDGLKSREGRSASPAMEDRLTRLDSDLARLRADSDKLRTAQSDTSEELGHIRAALANADIGMEQLRSSIEEHDLTQRKAIADVNARVDRARQGAAPVDVTGSIAAQPARRRVRMSGWAVQDAWDNGAIIAGSGGTMWVGPGSEVPGLGRITGVRQRGNHWVVTTDRGMLVQR